MVLLLVTFEIYVLHRSPVLERMFETNMKEQRESVVDIKDASMADVYQLVVYMYTGRIEEEYKSYREL